MPDTIREFRLIPPSPVHIGRGESCRRRTMWADARCADKSGSIFQSKNEPEDSDA